MGTNQAERLGQLVVARRIQLGMRTSVALAEVAGLTPRVISDLELGRRSNFSASTKAQIEGALKWHTGSIDDALKGGEPRPIRGARLSGLLQTRSDDNPDSGANSLPALAERRERIREGVDAHRKLFSEMLAEYFVMSARNAKFLENSDNPVVHESRAEMAELMYKATRSVVIHFLVQLDPSWDMAEAVDAVTSLLTPEDRETLESSRETYIRAYEILDQISGPARPSGAVNAPNVTNLADRRPVPPPPTLDDLDVAASLREKRSDVEREDEDGPHELSLLHLKSGLRTKREFASSAEAYEYAREFLISEGEKPHLVDAALGDAGQHTADTSAEGYGVRIRKIVDRAAISHDDE